MCCSLRWARLDRVASPHLTEACPVAVGVRLWLLRETSGKEEAGRSGCGGRAGAAGRGRGTRHLLRRWGGAQPGQCSPGSSGAIRPTRDPAWEVLTLRPLLPPRAPQATSNWNTDGSGQASVRLSLCRLSCHRLNRASRPSSGLGGVLRDEVTLGLRGPRSVSGTPGEERTQRTGRKAGAMASAREMQPPARPPAAPEPRGTAPPAPTSPQISEPQRTRFPLSVRLCGLQPQDPPPRPQNHPVRLLLPPPGGLVLVAESSRHRPAGSRGQES